MSKLFLLVLVTFYGASALASSLIYVPEKFIPKTARVVVVIHGCLQTPEAMALGTGWNQKADKKNLIIIYPQVPTGTNAIDCWSWYLPENQTAASGQLASVRNEIRNWKVRLNIERAPVFITGISSGAATASGLISCFPEDFAGGAIHSGPSYGLASNLAEGENVLKNGVDQIPNSRACIPGKFRRPLMVIHGSADQVVNRVNVQTLITDFLSHASRSTHETRQANGLKYSIENYTHKGRLAGRVVIVEGLGHAWAGYTENLRHSHLLGPKGNIPTQIPFFSPQGPSSTNLIVDFFEDVR